MKKEIIFIKDKIKEFNKKLNTFINYLFIFIY